MGTFDDPEISDFISDEWRLDPKTMVHGIRFSQPEKKIPSQDFQRRLNHNESGKIWQNSSGLDDGLVDEKRWVC